MSTSTEHDRRIAALAAKTWAEAREEIAARETPARIRAQAAMLAAEGQEIVTDGDRARARHYGTVIVRHAGMGGLGVVFDSQLKDVELLAGWVLVEDHRRPSSVGRVDVVAAAQRAAEARRG